MPDVLLYKQLPTYLREAIESGLSRTLCPKCSGGRSGELSLSVRPDGDVMIKLSCWRSTCDWYGYTVTDGEAKFETRKLKPPSVYRESTWHLTSSWLEMLQDNYGLQSKVAHKHGWRINATALVMPILCPNGGIRGHTTRTFGTPKRVMTYKATAQPWLDHWPTDEGRPVVVVEDTLSACRLAGLGYHAVALLGTSISVPQAQEIRDVGKDVDVWLALDQDATAKAMNLARRHQHIVRMLPVCLTEDIKNMKRDEDIHGLFRHG